MTAECEEEPHLVGRETGRWRGEEGRSSGSRARYVSNPYQMTNVSMRRQQRAGGKGEKGKNQSNRMVAISKKLSMLCRHSNEVSRQKDGFAAWSEIAGIFRQRENVHFNMQIEDVEDIVNGAGGNFKKRFEWGKMKNGERALRTSQGHSQGSGVTSDYLAKVDRPGLLAHGTSAANALPICTNGIRRMDRIHIHLGRMVNARPVGIRPGSEAIVVIDGDLCVSDDITIYESANHVMLTEGVDGILHARYIPQAFETATGKILYSQSEGWLGEQGEVEESEDFTALSGECDVSPLTRTCVESNEGIRLHADRSERRKWISADPFDGNVAAEVELDSNVSTTGSNEQRRESTPSVSESEQSGGVGMSEEQENTGDGEKEVTHSPEW